MLGKSGVGLKTRHRSVEKQRKFKNHIRREIEKKVN